MNTKKNHSNEILRIRKGIIGVAEKLLKGGLTDEEMKSLQKQNNKYGKDLAKFGVIK